MSSKALILLGLFAFLLVVSEMAAAGTVELESEKTVQPDGYGGGHGGYGGGGYRRPRGPYCRHGCCYKGYRGGCSRCCSYAGEAVQTQPGN